MEVLETNRLKFALCPEVGAEPTSIEAAVECEVIAEVPVSASLFTCGWSHRVDYESDDNETTEEMRQKNEDLSLLRRRDLPPLARHNKTLSFVFHVPCSFAEFIHYENATCKAECDCGGRRAIVSAGRLMVVSLTCVQKCTVLFG